MTLNSLIKNAISDKNLRAKLLSEPVKTCSKYAVKADPDTFARFEMRHFNGVL